MVAAPIYIPIIVHEVSLFSVSLIARVIFCLSERCEVIFNLCLTFLYLLVYLLMICMCCFFFMLSCIFLYILDINPFLFIFCKYLFPINRCLFHFVDSFLCLQKLFSLMLSCLFTFALASLAEDTYEKILFSK